MYAYEINACNPEGTDWSLKFNHEEKYSYEEFSNIAEAALVYALEECIRLKEVVYIANITCEDKVLEYMQLNGFEIFKQEACYGIDPYWGKEDIKSKRLLELIERKDDASNGSVDSEG